MKVSSSLLVSSLIGTTVAADRVAEVYTFDSTTSSTNPPVLSPETFKLVLAQHFGIEQFYELDATDEAKLSHVNAFGGAQRQLFESPDPQRSEVLVILEGINSAKGKSILFNF